jgi:hypothetical protein
MVSCSEITHACLQARQLLAQSPIREIRRLRVEETESGLILRGVVSRYYFKQLAQERVRLVCQRAGCDIINQIHVRQT